MKAFNTFEVHISLNVANSPTQGVEGVVVMPVEIAPVADKFLTESWINEPEANGGPISNVNPFVGVPGVEDAASNHAASANSYTSVVVPVAPVVGLVLPPTLEFAELASRGEDVLIPEYSFRITAHAERDEVKTNASPPECAGAFG